ncbi:multimeric flavodoxin WrbA [Desulfosporosinus orientis DSM 765]|uniref:Multimeric flavodoxin WrbA n=1 Tax=Desulfosporosinus orientis (strain ATCC 19365 / DSM 765 / NCIMB 8382 / VKM B-1628 / Singapore I) TaxID=768706 RepID=G7WDG6_DESOD|nr:flavodoxin domain-containing protein [Desulfosporosinus orientis]AET67935.1 multimeric flavodoxin WrbA [Desulfosporosinus orientis DSM 765]
MKIAIVYFSTTGNTQKVADLIAEGAMKVENVDVKSMSVEEIDNEFLTEAKAVIFGSPTIAGTFAWQLKQWLDTSKNVGGKLGAVFATANYVGGGAEVAEIAMIAEMLVKGMLVYSSGVAEGQPFIHYGPVCIKDGDDGQKERAKIFGERIARKAAELFN